MIRSCISISILITSTIFYFSAQAMFRVPSFRIPSPKVRTFAAPIHTFSRAQSRPQVKRSVLLRKNHDAAKSCSSDIRIAVADREIKEVMELFKWEEEPNYCFSLCDESIFPDSLLRVVADRTTKEAAFEIILPHDLYNASAIQRKFVYAHEIGHMQQHITRDENIHNYMTLLDMMKRNKIKGDLLSTLADLATLSHRIELDADRRAALALKSCKGGIECMHLTLKNNPQYLNGTLDHPCPVERIKHLEHLRKEFGLE